MRTPVIIILVIAIATAVYAGTRGDSSPEPSAPVAGTPTPTVQNSVQTATSPVANDGDRCILAISGARYDVTDYLREHPGGSSRIIPFCGKDATTAFQTQGGEGSHSGIAKETLEEYRLP